MKAVQNSPIPVGVIVALGLTQNIGYGTLYYSFSILAPAMAADFGWSREWIFGVLSLALLTGGLTAPWLGRLFDDVGAGRVMTFGSGTAALALAACAFAPNAASFVVALVAIEVAANLVQYGAAFALLVQIRPEVASRSITYLTLLAGFASTIFWPLTSMLHQQLSWQSVYLIFAALNLMICLPVHACLWQSSAPGRAKALASGVASAEGALSTAWRNRGFHLMVTAFSLVSLTSAAVLVHMVPLLDGLGLMTSAAIVGALFGPAQVASRLINMVLGARIDALSLAIIAAGLISTSIVILLFSAPAIPGAMLFAVIFGMGNGLLSIVTGTLPLYLFGSHGYGALQGKMMAARLILSAAAPFLLALSMSALGIEPSLWLAATFGGLAVVMFAALGRLLSRSL